MFHYIDMRILGCSTRRSDMVGLDEFQRAFITAALDFVERTSIVVEPVSDEANERLRRLQRRSERSKH